MNKVKKINGWLLFICYLFLTGCHVHTLEDYREEGEGLNHALLETLRSIHKKEQLLAALPRLQTLFVQLAEIMIAAGELKKSSVFLEEDNFSFSSELSDHLLTEINRLYQMESGRALLEKSQELAVKRLEDYIHTEERGMSCSASTLSKEAIN